jgi:chromosome segregation ATPase
MIPRRVPIILILMLAAVLLAGCAEETADLKQQIATLQKKLQKQENDLREFTGKFAPPKDFSADIQRIEDQQEKISQVLKTKVEPINNKLEEFRDWAQEAQKDREAVAKRLKALEQSAAENHKKVEAGTREIGRFGKEMAANKKSLTALSKSLEAASKSMVDLAKHVAEIRREVLDNNTKLVNAVKKTLPKLKESVVTDLKDKIAPLEAGLAEVKAGLEAERKAIAAAKGSPTSAPQAPVQDQAKEKEREKQIQVLAKRTRELEEVAASQKSYLLEMGSKVHGLEVRLRRALEQ